MRLGARIFGPAQSVNEAVDTPKLSPSHEARQTSTLKGTEKLDSQEGGRCPPPPATQPTP